MDINYNALGLTVCSIIIIVGVVVVIAMNPWLLLVLALIGFVIGVGIMVFALVMGLYEVFDDWLSARGRKKTNWIR